MKQSNVTNINTRKKVQNLVKKDSNVRHFYATSCPACGSIDCLIEKIPSYDARRDIAEITREGRKIFDYTQHNLEPIKWCRCPFEDEIVEE